MVMGDDSCSRGHGFESPQHILDGHFSYRFVAKIVFLKQCDGGFKIVTSGGVRVLIKSSQFQGGPNDRQTTTTDRSEGFFSVAVHSLHSGKRQHLLFSLKASKWSFE